MVTDDCWEGIKTYKTRFESDPKYIELKDKLEDCLKEKQDAFMELLEIDEDTQDAVKECSKEMMEAGQDIVKYLKDLLNIYKFIRNVRKYPKLVWITILLCLLNSSTLVMQISPMVQETFTEVGLNNQCIDLYRNEAVETGVTGKKEEEKKPKKDD